VGAGDGTGFVNEAHVAGGKPTYCFHGVCVPLRVYSRGYVSTVGGGQGSVGAGR
jgi:hypothetical protein